jgi:hypothetical protein
MTDDSNSELESSPRSGPLTQDGITVYAEIYKMTGRNGGWTLEVVDNEVGSTVWDTTFETDELAYRVFLLAVELEGIRSFVEAPLLNRLNLRSR